MNQNDNPDSAPGTAPGTAPDTGPDYSALVEIDTAPQRDFWMRELQATSSLIRLAIAQVGHDPKLVRRFLDDHVKRIQGNGRR